MPKSNRAFWRTKFRNNVARDAMHERQWKEMGWTVIVIWACGLKTEKNRTRTFRQVGKWLAELSA